MTTDRLIELHGGPRINPQDNLDFYIREAVQTAHDALRLSELSDETEAPVCEILTVDYHSFASPVMRTQ